MQMSNYPIWWDSTLTIYNKYEDPQTHVISWYRTVLNNCFWKNNYQRMSLGQVELETDSTIIRIPENSKYINSFDWIKLPNDKMKDYFTLADGDIIVNGNVADNIDEYTAGSRSTDFIQKYKFKGCIRINRLTVNTGLGRGLPHYHVEGI